MVAQVAVGKHGVAAVGLVDGFQQHPATDKAFAIGSGGSGGSLREVLGTVLEEYPVDARGTRTLAGHHQVDNTLGHVVERHGLGEPLVSHIATETAHHGVGGSTTSGLFGLHGEFDACENLTLGVALADAELGVVAGFGVDNHIAIGEAAEVHVGILHPTLSGDGGIVAAEGNRGIYMGCGHTVGSGAVAVDLNLIGGLVDTNTTHGGLHLLNSAVGIEEELFNLHRAALVVVGREEIAVIEQVPLALVVDNAVMVGPAAIGMLGHDETLVFIGSHGVLTHGITQHLSILSDIGVGEVVPAVGLESKRTFGLAVGQALEAVDTNHLHLAVAPFHGLLGVVVGELLHVGLQLGAAAIAPEDVGIAVRGLKHTGVDAVDALDRLLLGDERTCGAVGNGNANGKATTTLGGC